MKQKRIALFDGDRESRKTYRAGRGCCRRSKTGKLKGIFPNLVLMKLSAWHKNKGRDVSWYEPLLGPYDRVYASKVFTRSKTKIILPPETQLGGTGFRMNNTLPDAIEHIMPDYDLYGFDYSLGFLTRGCIRKCSWCIVPEKEGALRANATIEEFMAHKKIVLLDNNVLAHEHGLKQIEKLIWYGVEVDFNQGFDARLIDKHIAKMLGKVKWSPRIKLACDHPSQMPVVEKAIRLLRENNATPRDYTVLVLVKDIPEALERIMFLKRLGVQPFAQPYLDQENTPPTREQGKFKYWVNNKALFKSVKWEDFYGMKSQSPDSPHFDLGLD